MTAIKNDDNLNVEVSFDGSVVVAGSLVVGGFVGEGGSVVDSTKSVGMLMIFAVIEHLSKMVDELGQNSMLCDFDKSSENHTT